MSIEKVSVQMTPYEWNRLLDVLCDGLAICNRDQRTAITLYEEIATQLNSGTPVKIIHRQNPDPAYRPQAEVKPEPKADKEKPSKRTGWRFWA